MARIVGIELGTTNSLVAHLDATGRPELIPNAAGKRLTPSVVGLRKWREWAHHLADPDQRQKSGGRS